MKVIVDILTIIGLFKCKKRCPYCGGSLKRRKGNWYICKVCFKRFQRDK